ncbi:MAG: glycosyl hydrolase 53 family protein [Paludibacteraceae bacterium]|nr:glycosyl hydrolase 53 family protein [Paludibacteraceae bacterium]
MRKELIIVVITAAMLCMSACGGMRKETATSDAIVPVCGADLGWLSEMEHDSMLFYNDAAQAVDCISLFKNAGMNAVRLRLWVNHKTGWSNIEDVKHLAVRADKAGLPVMLDFHYSDFFADPQRQDKPQAWQNLSFDSLEVMVSLHTREALEQLRKAGVTPRWVQIGNEITYGMMWNDGKLDRALVNTEAYLDTLDTPAGQEWYNLARLSNAGYEAAKAVCPDVICITHVDNGFIPRKNWYKRFAEAGGKWDMIGLSHYPFTQDTLTWQQMNLLCAANVRELGETYHCPVMITEIGVVAEFVPDTSAMCITNFKRLMAEEPAYAGVFYWEPEVYGEWRPAEYIPLGWGAYHMGCMTPDGRISEAGKLLFQ